MSKAEIIAELSRLDAADLADVREWLERLPRGQAVSEVGLAPRSGKATVRTPRLARPADASAFAKQVVELPRDAAV
jgi:hypothetical protein